VQGSEEDIWAKRDEIIGEWGKLHNEELNLYSTRYYLGDQIEKIEMGRACSM
jgi:hypothetical protein